MFFSQIKHVFVTYKYINFELKEGNFKMFPESIG